MQLDLPGQDSSPQEANSGYFGKQRHQLSPWGSQPTAGDKAKCKGQSRPVTRGILLLIFNLRVIFLSSSSTDPCSWDNVLYTELFSVFLSQQRKSWLTSAYQQCDPLCSEMLAGCHIPLGRRAQKGLQVGLTGQALDTERHLEEWNCSALEGTHMSLLPAITTTNLLHERQVVLLKWLNQYRMKICVSVLLPREFPPSNILNFCDVW